MSRKNDAQLKQKMMLNLNLCIYPRKKNDAQLKPKNG